MKNDIIVAVELASSAIRGIAGKRQPNGSIEVIGLAEESSQSCIHKGVVDNIEKTTQAISAVIARLGLSVGGRITRVYVGLAGQSLRSKKNIVQRHFEEPTQITAQMVDGMRDANCSEECAGYSIHEVVQQESLVGNRLVDDAVGIQAEALEARFLNVIARTALEDNIRKCVKAAGLNIAEVMVSPLVLADSVLRSDEKRSGCAVVDMGAETTTVAIYSKNMLRHLIVLPIGGSNVTQDITTKKIEWDEAEALKIKYSTAYRSNSDTETENVIPLKYGQSIVEEELLNLIEARNMEIVANIWHQIKPYSDMLISGQIILTGGASRTKKLAQCFQHYAKCNKQIRIFRGLPDGISVNSGVMIPDDGRYLTLMSLMLHGDQNCVGAEEVQEPEPEKAEPVKETPAPEQKEEKQEKAPKKESVMKGFWKMIKDAMSEPE